MLLTQQNIESELSYAYLHAVASRAGFECTVAGRHSDGAGIDAVLRIRELFGEDSFLTNFTIDVQLKATIAEPSLRDGRYSFSLDIEHYDKLRSTSHAAALLLVVLFLPADAEEWLVHSEDRLIARRCAYWVSLRNAPPSANATSQTVYIPKENCLSVGTLRSLAARISRGEIPLYEL
jgi:hypothetical protein